MLRVPPLAPRLMPRLAASVAVAVTWRVPPSSVSELLVALPNGAPRLLSPLISRVPPLMLVPPE